MLKVTLKYLDNTTERVLNFFFKSTDLEGIQLSKVPAEADFFVVDFDRKIDDDFWQQIEESNQYAIVLCSDEQIEIDTKRTVKLLKPMKTENFSRSLQAISELINSKDDLATETVEPAEEQPIANENEAAQPVDEQSVEEGEKPLSETQEETTDKQSAQPPVLAPDESDEKQVSIAFVLPKSPDFDWDLFLQALHDEGELEQDLDYPVNLRDPNQLRKLYFEPKKYLYHHLMAAEKMGKDQQLDVSIRTPFCSIFYQWQENKFYHNFGDARFRAIQSSPAFKATVVSPGVHQTQTVRYGTEAQKLIWESAVFAGSGRLPDQTNPYHRMKLLKTPTSSYLTAFSQDIHYGNGSSPKRKIEKDAISGSFKQATKVIKTLAQKRHSLIELEEAHRQIPQQHLLTLYCAMQATNCVDAGGEQGRQKSLSAKIFSRLFG